MAMAATTMSTRFTMTVLSRVLASGTALAIATGCMASPQAIPTEQAIAPTPTPAAETGGAVFLPTPVPVVPTSTPVPTATPVPIQTIGELLAVRDDAALFVTELDRLGLLEQLNDPEGGPWTVLVPTDIVMTSFVEVFETLDEDEQLSAISGHVIAGIVPTDDFIPGSEFTSVSGGAISVDTTGALAGGGRVFGDSQSGTNGVVHRIDALVLPFTDSIDELLITGLNVLQPVLFEQQSSELTPSGEETLGLAADMVLGLARPVIISVEAHADPSEADATALTDARAEAARDFLIDRGVQTDRLETVGFGISQPAGDDIVANRRVVLVVLE